MVNDLLSVVERVAVPCSMELQRSWSREMTNLRMLDASRRRYSSDRLPDGRWAPRLPAHNLNLARQELACEARAWSSCNVEVSCLNEVRLRATKAAIWGSEAARETSTIVDVLKKRAELISSEG